MGKKMLEINAVDLSDYFISMSGLKPSGPGSVGQAKITLQQEAGGLSIVNKQVVKLWQAFDDVGAGVAQRGRYLIGMVEDKLTRSASNYKLWDLAVVDCNRLLKDLQIDADDSAAITIPAGSLASQVLALTQAVQRQGHASVAVQIDAVSFVANLVTSGMPAYTAKGKTYGQMLLELCQNAQVLTPALRPLFYIGVDTSTWGIGESVGGPVLHLYNGAVLPAPSYVFSDAPTGSQRYRYGTISRKLDSTQLATRGQSTYQGSNVATYADAIAGAAYPNPFVNHGLPGNKGHWQAPIAKDTVSQTLADAQAMLQTQIGQTRYPRESYTHGADVVVHVGEVVTEIDSLEDGLGSGVDYMVAQSAIDVTKDTDPFCTITLGVRRLELLETGGALLAAPAEGDSSPPFAPTNFVLAATTWDPVRGQYLTHWTWTNSASRDVDVHNVWFLDAYFQLHLEGELYRYMNPGQTYSVYVEAVDQHGNHSDPGYNPHLSGTIPGVPVMARPTFFVLASNTFDEGLGVSAVGFNWIPSTSPYVVTQRLYITVNGVITHYDIPDNTTTAYTVYMPDGAPYTNGYIVGVDAGGRESLPSTPVLAGNAVAQTVFSSFENGDFEVPNSYNSLLPKRWQFDQGSGTITYLSAGAGHGQRAVSFQWPSGLTKPSIIQSYNRVSDTDRYYVNALVKANSVMANGFDFTIAWIDGSGSGLGTTVGSIGNLTTAWARKNALTGVVPPAGARTASLQIAWSGAAAAGIFRYVDGVVFTSQAPGDALEPATPTTAGSMSAADKTLVDFLNSAPVTKTATFTADATASVYLCNSAGAFTANLPAASTCSGREYTFKQINTGKVTIDPNSSETIDGIATFPLSEKNQSVTIKSDGSNWKIITAEGLILTSDGTRWLGPEKVYKFEPLVANGFSANTIAYKLPLRTDRALLVTLWVVGVSVATTNNGSNYWNFYIERFDSSNTNVGVIANTDTHLLTAGVDETLEVKSFTNNPTATGDNYLHVWCAKTGSPGALTIYHAMYACEIYT